MRLVYQSQDFDLQIAVTGMHLRERYGKTVNEIRKDFPDKIIHSHFTGEAVVERSVGTIAGVSHILDEIQPDLFVIHGDRIEALAAATAASMKNVLIAHIEGGEVSGTGDEMLRHSTSKLSHVHFVANDTARSRLIQMGELSSSVVVIGSPDIDIMKSNELPSISEVCKHYEIEWKSYGIILYHPVTTEGLSSNVMDVKEIVGAVLASQKKWVVIYPNDDPFSAEILEVYKKRFRNNSWIRVLPSLRFESFITLLKECFVLIGNSSCGVREAPVFGIPSINIGSRQRERWKHDSILDIAASRPALDEAIQTQWGRRFTPSAYWGRGGSAELFLNYLYNPKLWNISIQKVFNDKQ
jgi:UDP-N-acetylglucosamine 2-epimerase (hydrolysing)